MTPIEIGMLDAIVGNPNFGTHGNYELEVLRDHYGFKDEYIAVLVREGLWEMRTSEFFGHFQYYYTFTDRWREIKKQGNYRAYLRWVDEQSIEGQKRQVLNDKLMEINLISGTITRRLYVATVWIAVASAVAALYYLTGIVEYFSGLIAKHLPLFYGTGVTVLLLLLGAGVGVSIVLLAQYLYKARKNSKPKST